MEGKNVSEETAPIDMLCDQCQSELKAGTTFYVDPQGKVLCTHCLGGEC